MEALPYIIYIGDGFIVSHWCVHLKRLLKCEIKVYSDPCMSFRFPMKTQEVFLHHLT